MAQRQRKTPTHEERQSAQAVGALDVGPKTPIVEAPDSILNKTSTYQDELDALGATGLEVIVDIEEIEKRIGLLSRIVLEHNLRKGLLSAKDKCDIALRAITVLEGSKQEVTWRDELKRKPKKVTLVALKKEQEEKEERLKSILLRKKEVQVAHAEAALETIRKKKPNGSTTDDVN